MAVHVPDLSFSRLAVVPHDVGLPISIHVSHSGDAEWRADGNEIAALIVMFDGLHVDGRPYTRPGLLSGPLYEKRCLPFHSHFMGPTPTMAKGGPMGANCTVLVYDGATANTPMAVHVPDLRFTRLAGCHTMSAPPVAIHISRPNDAEWGTDGSDSAAFIDDGSAIDDRISPH